MTEIQNLKEELQEVIKLLRELTLYQYDRFSTIEQKLELVTGQLDKLQGESPKNLPDKAGSRNSSAQLPTKRTESIHSPVSIIAAEQSKLPYQIISSQLKSVESAHKQPITANTGMLQGSSATNNLEVDTENIIDEFSSYKRKKAQVEAETLRSYLQKIETVITKSWTRTQKEFNNINYSTFVDQGLTVLHGIIEYYFVGYRKEIPDSISDYSERAKNIASINVFKDLNLLNKMEAVYGELKVGKKPTLAATVMRGWFERLERIYEEWLAKIDEITI
jgi:hypothetical protein